MIHVVYGSKVIESAAQQHDMLCNPTRYSCSKQELACLQAWMSWSSKQKQFGIALEWTQVWSKIGYWNLVDFGNDFYQFARWLEVNVWLLTEKYHM